MTVQRAQRTFNQSFGLYLSEIHSHVALRKQQTQLSEVAFEEMPFFLALAQRASWLRAQEERMRPVRQLPGALGGHGRVRLQDENSFAA